MRTTFFSSLMFALLTSASVAVTAAPAAPSSVGAPMTAEVQATIAEKINLNKADAQTLQKELAGIGKNKADAIVAYRESNGEFTSVDELIEVKGIGKSILEKNRDKLSVE